MQRGEINHHSRSLACSNPSKVVCLLNVDRFPWKLETQLKLRQYAIAKTSQLSMFIAVETALCLCRHILNVFLLAEAMNKLCKDLLLNYFSNKTIFNHHFGNAEEKNRLKDLRS